MNVFEFMITSISSSHSIIKKNSVQSIPRENHYRIEVWRLRGKMKNLIEPTWGIATANEPRPVPYIYIYCLVRRCASPPATAELCRPLMHETNSTPLHSIRTASFPSFGGFVIPRFGGRVVQQIIILRTTSFRVFLAMLIQAGWVVDDEPAYNIDLEKLIGRLECWRYWHVVLWWTEFVEGVGKVLLTRCLPCRLVVRVLGSFSCISKVEWMKPVGFWPIRIRAF